MKKKLTLATTFCLLMATTHIYPTSQTNYQIKGVIEFPAHLDALEFTILFEGLQTTSNKLGLYSLPAKPENKLGLSLLICRKIIQNFERKNTLKEIKIDLKKPYRYFELSRNEEGDDAWVEGKLQDSIIPQGCVVILMNPKMIDTVSSWEVELDYNFIKMPKIKLRKDIGIPVLTKSSTKSLIYSLDAKLFSEPVGVKSELIEAKGKGKVSVSMVY